MRFGCCASMQAAAPDRTGVEIVEQLRDIGYDYVELPLCDVASLPRGRFVALKQRVAGSGMGCEACNNLFPIEMKVTGNGAPGPDILAYIEMALSRAEELGAQVVVFGSGESRKVPEGFPPLRAWDQIIELLRLIGDVAARHSITIAIEPLRRRECNIVNTLTEALQLCTQVDHPQVRLVADFYHMAEEKEGMEDLLKAGNLVEHVHFARVEGRGFPREIGEDLRYSSFIAYLKAVGYGKRVSVEAYSSDFQADALAALRFFRTHLT